MARTAIVKIGDVEAVFDGRQFTSNDADIAAILNSTLRAYDAGVTLWEKQGYWPDPLVGIAKTIAKYNGGEMIAFDPPEPEELPEGAVY